ncbi:MAG: GlcNAc-PI de-N-acetylase [Chloroflexi bacterium]|nr:MAG: GlcNAc-PI de-N-acetylase [Chloroflexota bacterium]
MTATDFRPQTELYERRPVTAPKRLLVVYAHPDDEAFGNAGIILAARAAGVEVQYVCATRGECGTVDEHFLADHADVRALRTAEQIAAAEALDLGAVHFLNYRDSNMPGTPDNLHPEALVMAPVTDVAERVAAIIDAFESQYLITFPPYGGYGHPDHIAIHHATTLALTQAKWQVSEVYYSTFSTSLLRVIIGAMRLLGKNPRAFGRNGDIDMVRVAEEATPITTSVDCRHVIPAKIAAWKCHASQGGGITRVPAFLWWWFYGSETLTQVTPAPAGRRTRLRFDA